MASLDSVRQKLYRAKQHWDELLTALLAYYESNPGELCLDEDSAPETHVLIFREKKAVPVEIPFILGDALQNLRSSLDYLIWELVEAAEKPTNRLLMFPIALTRGQYEDALKRHRVDGVPSEATALIDSFQPYHSTNPKETVLGVLDELTNVNKHRRVIFTGLHAVDELPSHIPCIVGGVRRFRDGELIEEVPVHAVLTLKEGLSKHIEITNCIDTAARFISEEMLPLFEKFFK